MIGSWLLDLAAKALCQSPPLEEDLWSSIGFRRRPLDHVRRGRGRSPGPVLLAALYSRFGSSGLDDFTNRIVSALRKQFGGHAETALG